MILILHDLGHKKNLLLLKSLIENENEMPFFMTFSTFSCRTIVRQRNRDNKQSDNKIKSDLRVPVGCTESSQLEPAEADRAVWTQAPPDPALKGWRRSGQTAPAAEERCTEEPH